jgi:hydrogenase/urease accessory protein HupE
VPLGALQAGSGSAADAARRYVALGIEHILVGIDHLLFVLGLLLIVSGPWMLIKTITAFTLAHSITLALATLGFVDLPSGPVEAAIALSIVFLGAEILRARQGRPGLTTRRPWVVAFAFGLLHGLGFAGALTAIGLPPGEIPLALLFFNVGVEIGQLMFVAAFLALACVLRQLQVIWPRWAEPLPAYAIGTVAAFWFIERTSAIIAMS